MSNRFDLPDDHVTLLGCPWREHPQSKKTQGLVEEILDLKEAHGWSIYGVTGASGSGKDSLVDAVGFKNHTRFGDYMKDWAFELGMVPHNREYYENNREARFDKLPNGSNALSAWIALDVIRTYNPFVFIEAGLSSVINQAKYAEGMGLEGTIPLIFSGMRTEVGLDIVREISDRMYRVVREDHKAPKDATLDELQVIYPVDEVVTNNGTLEELQAKAEELLKP